METVRKIRAFFRRLGRKRVLEYGLPIVVLCGGLVTYLLVSEGHERGGSPLSDFRDRTFINALYHYRLENLERAELLFMRALESSKSQRKKSTALLFLGNIYYKRKVYDRSLEYYESAISQNSKNLHALHNISLALMMLGREDEALRYAKQLYGMKERLPKNLLLLGDMQFALGNYEDAAAIFSEGSSSSIADDEENSALSSALFSYNLALSRMRLEDDSLSAELYETIMERDKAPDLIKGLSAYRLGVIYEGSDIGRSEKALENALDFFPSSGELGFNLALLYLKDRRYEQAVSLLRGVNRTVDEEHRQKMLGYALYRNKKYEEALEIFLKYDAASARPDLSYIIGDLYVKTGKPHRALEYYEHAIAEADYGGAFINLVRIFQEEGSYERAKELCEQYAEKEPENPLPRLLLADVLFTLGDPAEARAQLEVAEDLSENHEEDLFKVARVWLDHGYHNNALLIYHGILESQPQNLEVMVRIAAVYLKTGHNERALGLLERVRERTSDLSEFYTVSLLLAGCADTDRAKEVYGELIEDFPYRYDAYYNLSLLLIENGEYEASEQSVRSCMESVEDLDPQVLGNLHSILGYLNVKLGKQEEAMREFAEAKRLDPKSEIPFLNLRVLGAEGR
ncbi:MAG TPA: tetratricopeptide repeat protein [Spirochaetota bacterium]|nr:tetratricopeptide repeat protein [Spirochaetota bacterium]